MAGKRRPPGSGDQADGVEAFIRQGGDEAVRAFVEDLFSGLPVDSRALPSEGPVYVALRREGRKAFAGWFAGPFLGDTLNAALAAGRAEAGEADFDTVEICQTFDYQTVLPGEFASVFGNRFRGLRGIEMRHKDRVERLAPSEAIARNLGFKRFAQRVCEGAGVSEQAFRQSGGEIRRFGARQLLVSLGLPVRAVLLHRGNRVIAPRAIGPRTLEQMVETMGGWMLRNVGPDGRMTYKYWPSRGEESSANNTIRQFMASLCLVRLAKALDDPAAPAAAARNLDYNLKQFFRLHEGHGVIAFDGSAKLGAAALAALAILEHPQCERYRDFLDPLVKGVEKLWQADGAFRTFHFPADRNDNHNFYPGEALLFWAQLYGRTKDDDLLDRFMKSFATYRDWHRANRNPAFIPWHTQAYVPVYLETGEAALKDFVFEMNDWLVTTQQWEDAPAADFMGRFYDPKFKGYGPPHASSTGVYLEGLADAYRLADAIGDRARAEAYETAIWRGLRSLRQLQFLDDVDMFYIERRDRVRGALRVETYNNEIRVDNVQHGLMAILKLRSLPAFRPGAAEAS